MTKYSDICHLPFPEDFFFETVFFCNLGLGGIAEEGVPSGFQVLFLLFLLAFSWECARFGCWHHVRDA
jgi:hypothetical protein